MRQPRRVLISRRTLMAGAAGFSALRPAAAMAQPGGFRVIRARPGMARLRGADHDATPIWGFEGTLPGPVLRVKRGEEVKVRLVNESAADTAIHWHGVRVPNTMDGVPGLTQKAVAPGESFDYRFTPPDAGTFWYRAPTRSRQQRTLYGLLIVDEAEPVDVDRDLALILDAWPLASDKDTHFTVNGLPSLDIPVIANERVRLRLVNAAPDRLLTVRVDRHAATVMAIDGQPAEPFVARESRVTLSPGNRVDLFIDAALESGSTASIFVSSDSAEVPIARFIYDAAAPARAAVRQPAKPLPPNPLPQRMNFAAAPKLEISLDDARYRPADGNFGRALFTTVPRTTIMIAFKNPAEFAHVVHVHGHHVRLLDALDDGWKPFWLDSILVPPRQTTRVAFVADNRGKWLVESQVFGAENGIRTWFEVT